MGASEANASVKAAVSAELKKSERDPGTPRVGDIVWYQDQYQVEPLAAMVTHVFPGRGNILNLCVFMQRGDANGMTRVYRGEDGEKGTWRPRPLNEAG